MTDVALVFGDLTLEATSKHLTITFKNKNTMPKNDFFELIFPMRMKSEAKEMQSYTYLNSQNYTNLHVFYNPVHT